MELIVINENKLKIVMKESDMKLYGIDENEFHCSITNTRQILEKILHNSPVYTGFENISSSDKILIQLYPDKNGGCELYVTKITLDENEETLFMPKENEERYLLPKATQKKETSKTSVTSFRFERLEHAIKASREARHRSCSATSSFYRDNDGKYYLLIGNLNDRQGEDKYSLSFVSEFGEITNVENTYLMLSEYGTCIFTDKAIESLSRM